MMKRFIRVVMLPCMVTVLLSALSFATIEAKAAPASGKVFQNLFSSTSCGQWSVVPSPNPNVVPSGLSGVAAVSATDAWAVGTSGSQMSHGQTLIEHRDGENSAHRHRRGNGEHPPQIAPQGADVGLGQPARLPLIPHRDSLGGCAAAFAHPMVE